MLTSNPDTSNTYHFFQPYQPVYFSYQDSHLVNTVAQIPPSAFM
jgi:hypothetical protein